MWICKVCWRHGIEDEESAVGAHLRLMGEEERHQARNGMDGEKFKAVSHKPEFLFSEAAIRIGRICREPGPKLDLEGAEPLILN